jgi:hypothetical protein
MKTRLITFDLAATALFAVVVLPAALLDRNWSDVIAVAVCMALFAVGMFAFLASLANAFERSRRDELAAAGLFVLTGDVAPKDVKLRLLGALGAQVLVAIAAASIGFAQQDNAQRLNPMAFAVLVPMLGFGLNGLWAARHGRFGPRILKPTTGRPAPDNDVEMEHNSTHG